MVRTPLIVELIISLSDLTYSTLEFPLQHPSTSGRSVKQG